MAYDKSTGKPVWSSDLGQQAYASLVLAELAGRPQLLDFAAHALNGVDPETGTKLWSAEWTGSQNGIHCAQPLLLGDDRVFISTGYGKGAAAFKIREVAGQSSAEQLWAQTTMKNKFNSSVLVDGHIYGFDEGILACIDAETGDRHGDAQPVGADLLDIVGRVAIADRFRHAIDGALEMLESEQQRAIEDGKPRHGG